MPLWCMHVNFSIFSHHSNFFLDWMLLPRTSSVAEVSVTKPKDIRSACPNCLPCTDLHAPTDVCSSPPTSDIGQADTRASVREIDLVASEVEEGATLNQGKVSWHVLHALFLRGMLEVSTIGGFRMEPLPFPFPFGRELVTSPTFLK